MRNKRNVRRRQEAEKEFDRIEFANPVQTDDLFDSADIEGRKGRPKTVSARDKGWNYSGDASNGGSADSGSDQHLEARNLTRIDVEDDDDDVINFTDSDMSDLVYAFMACDLTSSGEIDARELQAVLTVFGARRQIDSVRMLFEKIDADGGGTLDEAEVRGPKW